MARHLRPTHLIPIPASILPNDIFDYQKMYEELEPKFEKRIEKLSRLSALARDVGRKQYAQDISEEIRDYKRDYGYEATDRYLVAFESNVHKGHYLSNDDRVHLMREAIYDIRKLIEDIDAMILRIKEKLYLEPNDDNYRKCKKSKPKSKITIKPKRKGVKTK